jgi:hypothetical protein
VATETDNLSPAVWNEIYRAIERGGASREIYQGVVTDRDSSRGYVWVRELSSDPIEVTGHSTEVKVMIGGVLQSSRVPPATPEIGDVVTLVRTASDQFKCVGVQQTTRKWQADPRFGLIPADSITANEIAPDAVGTSELAPLAVTNAEVAASTIEGTKLNWHIGSTPPGGATDGTLWLTQNGSNGYMLFMRNAAGDATYPWYFIGGSPIFQHDGTDVGTSGSTWFANPNITIPREGYYLLQASGSVGQTPNANTNFQWDMSLGDGTTAYTDPFRAYIRNRAPATAALLIFSWAVGPAWVLLTAGQLVKLMAIVTGWDLTSYNRTITATPIRVG